MKNIMFMISMVCVMLVGFTGCIRPYDKPEYVEVGPNETAFVVPMFTDSNIKTEDQVQLNSESAEFYQKCMVNSKLIQIPHKWIQTGRFAYDGYYKGTVRVITVDLTPRSGTWLQSDNNAVKVETAASQGITIPMSYTMRIKAEDAANYLSFYKSVDFQHVIDVQINRYFTAEAAKYFHEVEYKDIAGKRDEIISKAVTATKEYFKLQGITIDQLAIVDGLVYDDASLQRNIDEQAKVQAQLVLEQQKAELLAQTRKNETYEAETNRLKMEAQRSTFLIEQDRLDRQQQRENTKIIAEAQAKAIEQGKYAPVPETVIVQDLNALGSVRDILQPSK